ncbi:MAG: hypothetical protein WC489_00475 [Patescibacteria group bacterium]
MSEGPRSPLGTTGFKPCSPLGEFRAPDKPTTKEAPKKTDHTPLGPRLLNLLGFQTTDQKIAALQQQLQEAQHHKQQVTGYTEQGDGQSDFPAVRHPGDKGVIEAIDARITGIQAQLKTLQTRTKR